MAERPPYAIPSVDQRDQPAIQPVTGNVTIDGDVNVDVAFPETQAVTGTVDIGNLDDLDLDVTFPGTMTVNGTVTVANPTAATDTSLLAKEATLATLNTNAANRYQGGKTPVTATVTASGDTVIYTPAAGMAVRLYWVSAINDPDEATSPLIIVKIGALECYRSYALSHWEVFEGAPDDELTINLSGAASVAVTAHIEEV